ncbi:Oar protein [Acidisarcina polymorpha]|uniref:Oar protein n=1 Tax=Acidisarcina polymorpha TaxID=2211140 RepID=A0A2Z5G2H6_9BACT|nr:carboxypeptidase regulatory-like domain-containing protein [Acidisarcina polymorpha]AXC12865.1 Oar protein [Acidisarcina polymorpha]
MLTVVARFIRSSSRFLCLAGILSASLLHASVGGSISGTVKDPAGSLVPNAEITLDEVNTGLVYHARSDNKGHYTLPVLPIGHYRLDVEAPGFQGYQRLEIVLDTNAALTLDATLQVGNVAESVNVTDNTLHVETTSTQMGQVISGRQMTAVPLDGRSFTDLLSLQPGVAPATSLTSSTVQDVGATILNPSGTLNPGTISVNGQREFANFFSVNGSDAEEDVNAGTAIIPNLDSIAEFRIITGNFDAEYGEFSGGQINVVTKSGGNNFHGSAFDFLRNTDLDARNYFSPTRGVFRQNQFGGTIGGPIRRDKTFFFVDYQGTRQTQGIDTGNISVPSNQDRSGNLQDVASGLTGSVGGPYFASLLTQKLGYPVVASEPYYVPGCTTTAECVFPNATIPLNAWSIPAQRMLQYIPAPNTAAGTFATSSSNQTVRDDKAGVRLDANTRLGLLSAYYFIDDFNLTDPYPVAQSGASVPGFSAITTGRAQLISLGDTKTLSATAVNELHFSYLRDFTNLGQPLGGRGVSLTSQGFENADGTPSIVPLDPKGESVENLNFNGFSTGAAANQLIQSNNTYQASDTFSKVLGNHTMKYGAEFHIDQVNAHPIAQFNGNFVFSGTETGVDFADFLIGVPSQYNQSQLNPFYARNKYIGLFAQDSWHVLPTLTLNYGLRWDRIAPWTEKYNQISTFVPGAQSVVFPGAPAGILYPGDPGVPSTLAPIGNRSFSPRVGFAWSPQADTGSLLGKLLGAPGSTSIRGSFGNFYTAIDALSIGVLAANAPYGTTYTSPAPPLFATPFINAADGQSNGQPFPYTFAPLNSSRRNPDPNINWSTYEPISGIPGYDIHNRTPYTEEWMLSLERQAGPNTVFSASYVGTSSHRQRVLIEPNSGNPALCLSLSQPGEVQPGTLTCGPNGEDTVYFPIGGGQVNGTRGPLGPNFGSNALQSTIGHANYNALEVSARHTSGRLEFAASYTYGKSLDQSSNIAEEVNPFNPALSYALSSFDVKHNFVVSYEYQLPIDQLFSPDRLTRGWSLSGITRFSSGFPVTMVNNGDNSLIGTNPNGINNSSIDEPDYNGGPLRLSHNPRINGHNYFAAGAFTMNALGTPGTAKRRFFYGPGTDNFDMAVAKNLPLTESKSVLFRVEAFNLFNHTQFSGPNSVDGDIGSTTFGQAISAAPARVLQGAVKFSF